MTPTRVKWTILVYMNAANDLDAYSMLNVLQMQQVATNPQVRIVLQWKQSTRLTPTTATFNGTRRYLIKPSQTGSIQSQLVQNLGIGVDMGIPKTLHDFIAWGQQQYPADHTVVVLWDHGNGWLPQVRRAKVSPPPAFSYDQETGHSIQIWQLNAAYSGLHTDITAFDCSLMQMDEVASQMAGLSDYVAGSEESPPGAGYPYQRVFSEFTNNPDQTPLALSKAFVDGMLNEPTYSTEKIEQSVVDTSKMANVATATITLRQALVANVAALQTLVPSLRTSVQSYSPTSTRYFFDSIDLCNQLSSETTISTIQSACTACTIATQSAVVWEGHNTHSPGSHGLAIDFSPSSYFNTVSSDYKLLGWDASSGWSQWLSVAP